MRAGIAHDSHPQAGHEQAGRRHAALVDVLVHEGRPPRGTQATGVLRTRRRTCDQLDQRTRAGETHVAVISDFHIVLVRLPDREATPTRGARVVAIGPLFRARDGQREIQAFRFDAT